MKFITRNAVRKLNARQPGRGQELSKAAFSMPGLDCNPVQQQAVAGDTQDHAAFSFSNGLTQFVPGDLELGRRAPVARSVKPHMLHQNVQAVNKWARRRLSRLTCAGARNRILPRLAATLA